jgi:hypothetical protein
MRYILRRPRAFWVSVCNLVGLAFSLVGVVLLLLFALPPEVPETGTVLTADNSDEAKLKAETRCFTRNAHIGLALVVVGTALEAVPPFSTAIGSWRRRPPIAATSRSTGERSTMWAPPHLEGATPVSTNWLSVVTAIGAVIISGISIYLGYKPTSGSERRAGTSLLYIRGGNRILRDLQNNLARFYTIVKPLRLGPACPQTTHAWMTT